MSRLPLPLQIVDYVCGAMKTQAVHACAEPGIADLLKDGPKSTAQLAEATGTDHTNPIACFASSLQWRSLMGAPGSVSSNTALTLPAM